MMPEPVRTLNDILFHVVDRFDKPDLLKAKQEGTWRDISSRELAEKVGHVSMGLAQLGVESRSRVALMSETRAEWLITDLGITSAGAITVPIYPTLTAENCEHILKDSQASVLVAARRELLDRILPFRDRVPSLEHLVQLDREEVPSGVLTLDQVMEKGQQSCQQQPDLWEQRSRGVGPEELATIIYTSGTTGLPKGVMLTHWNLISNARAATSALSFSDRDVALSLLPLSHILEKLVHYALLYQGATIAYAESIDKVPQNLMEISPTIMVAVPRLFEKFMARIQEAGKTGWFLKRWVFRRALAAGKKRADCLLAGKEVPAEVERAYQKAHRLVFSKIYKKLGGRMQTMVSGGAPLPAEVGKFFFQLGLQILEGYGLTETSPVIALNRLDRFKFGTVGPPVEGVDVRIAEDGEILVRGPNVMKGYYNLPKETEEALKEDWFHTGDIGHLDEDGFLAITDRKKDLIKTSGGKYVAPQPIENRLKLHPLVSQAVIVGNRRKYTAVLLVPDFESLKRFAQESGLGELTSAKLIQHPKVREEYQRALDELNQDLASFETLKKFELVGRDFTIEDGEMTPTLKVKRRVVEERYKGLIDRMYED